MLTLKEKMREVGGNKLESSASHPHRNLYVMFIIWGLKYFTPVFEEEDLVTVTAAFRELE